MGSVGGIATSQLQGSSMILCGVVYVFLMFVWVSDRRSVCFALLVTRWICYSKLPACVSVHGTLPFSVFPHHASCSWDTLWIHNDTDQDKARTKMNERNNE